MSRVARLYALLLRLLPSSVRRADGEEIVGTFAVQLVNAVSRRERAGLLVRTFVRLPAVILAEWSDRARGGGPGPERRAPANGAADRLVQICKHAVRGLRRNPGFLWSTVLLLGLGVGGVTTVFTLVDHVMLRPLPYPAADRLFEVTRGSHSGPLWRGMQELGSVEAWAAASTDEVNLTGVGRREELRATGVTRDFFTLFGARPVVGRLLAADDFESADRVVLSAGLWERMFGGDPAVVGRTIIIDGRPHVVIGVVYRSFAPPEAVSRQPGRSLEGCRLDQPDVRESRLPRPFRGRSVGAWRGARRGAGGDGRVLTHMAAEDPRAYVERDGSVRELPVVDLKNATTGEEVREGLGLLFGAGSPTLATWAPDGSSTRIMEIS